MKEILTDIIFNEFPRCLENRYKSEYIADALIAAGVIIMPYKIGAAKWIINHNDVQEVFVYGFSPNFVRLKKHGGNHCTRNYNEIYDTKAEAQAALNGEGK